MLKISDLKHQLSLLKSRQPGLLGQKDEDVFPAWVLLTQTVVPENRIAETITGAKNDGDADAILIDRHAVWVVQSKLHANPGESTEPTSAVRDLASIANYLRAGPSHRDHRAYWERLKNNPRDAYGKMKAASQAVRKDKLPIRLVFASTGRFTQSARRDYEGVKYHGTNQVSVSLLDYRDVSRLLTNYIRDIAPSIPEVRLRILNEDAQASAMGDASLVAWTLVTSAAEISSLYSTSGEQIFARNIRHGLGDKSHVNVAIKNTLLREPHRFWFLNNGLTISCDEAHVDGETMVMRGAQIINGQQTTRTINDVLNQNPRNRAARNAQVAVRVVSFENIKSENEADRLVSKVVEATNFQNAITEADLRSNDSRQIEIARELQSRGYLFIRRRGKHGAPTGLSHLQFKVKREVLFTAAAGTLIDSVALREGQRPLFEVGSKVKGDMNGKKRIGYYKKIVGLPTNHLIAAWFFWRRVNLKARGYPERQGAKFLVHYRAFKDVKTNVGYLDRLVRMFELENLETHNAIDEVITAYFLAATKVYRRERVIDGVRLLPKPYHQRRESSGNFDAAWNQRRFILYRNRVSRALDTLRGIVGDK